MEKSENTRNIHGKNYSIEYINLFYRIDKLEKKWYVYRQDRKRRMSEKQQYLKEDL